MTDQASLRAAILAAVPADGSTIGNQSMFEILRSHFPTSGEVAYWQGRDALIAEGRGRGGSVRRVKAKLSTSDSSTLAEQALNEARVLYAPQTSTEVVVEKVLVEKTPARGRSSMPASFASASCTTGPMSKPW